MIEFIYFLRATARSTRVHPNFPDTCEKADPGYGEYRRFGQWLSLIASMGLGRLIGGREGGFRPEEDKKFLALDGEPSRQMPRVDSGNLVSVRKTVAVITAPQPEKAICPRARPGFAGIPCFRPSEKSGTLTPTAGGGSTMDELGIDFVDAVPWFAHAQDQPYVLIHVSPASAAQLAESIGVPLRRCYITDADLDAAAQRPGVTRAEIVHSKLPDAGATMSGDFGEVLGYFYQAARELPATAIGPKKWRLKQDRTKPAPKSDVVHFVMPNRPHPSEADAILCAEVKAKATAGTSTPIADAIADCKKDRTSRLASTLVWLRERALTTDLGDVDLPLLDRFIQAVDSPPVAKRFRAVAVICNALLTNELVAAPSVADPEFTLVVIGVPNLHQTYTAAFAAAQASA